MSTIIIGKDDAVLFNNKEKHVLEVFSSAKRELQTKVYLFKLIRREMMKKE